MTDLLLAKNNLSGHSVCFCRGGGFIFGDKRGIAPIMELIDNGVDLSGYSVADKVVGKAAAMLFVKCGIKSVFAKTLSQSAERILNLFGLKYEYETLAENIINRAGTDICPMEKSVMHTDDIDEAYAVLKNKVSAIGG